MAKRKRGKDWSAAEKIRIEIQSTTKIPPDNYFAPVFNESVAKW